MDARANDVGFLLVRTGRPDGEVFTLRPMAVYRTLDEVEQVVELYERMAL